MIHTRRLTVYHQIFFEYIQFYGVIIIYFNIFLFYRQSLKSKHLNKIFNIGNYSLNIMDLICKILSFFFDFFLFWSRFIKIDSWYLIWKRKSVNFFVLCYLKVFFSIACCQFSIRLWLLTFIQCMGITSIVVFNNWIKSILKQKWRFSILISVMGNVWQTIIRPF